MKFTLNCKPLSVNKVWQGRRFKTKDYKDYEKEVTLTLPNEKMDMGFYRVKILFGIKNFLRSDVDNFIKPLMDIIVKKGIIADDRFVLKYEIEKVRNEPEFICVDIAKLL